MNARPKAPPGKSVLLLGFSYHYFLALALRTTFLLVTRTHGSETGAKIGCSAKAEFHHPPVFVFCRQTVELVWFGFVEPTRTFSQTRSTTFWSEIMVAQNNSAAEKPQSARNRLSTKKYDKELARLHVKLVSLQEWVVQTGAKVCILFEGRDGAGKGGTIKAITERVSPRIFRVVALPAPTNREKTQMYMQRYVPYLPAAGEIVIFDRSWYNRAGVERVMGFCTEAEVKSFLKAVPLMERVIIDSGVILLKYWLEVSEQEQTRRLEARINDERKVWKLSQMDLDSYSRWYDYSRARDDMFVATDTDVAPWFVAPSNDKKRVRLNIISHLLASIPYKSMTRAKVKLPKRQKSGGYRESNHAFKFVPAKF